MKRGAIPVLSVALPGRFCHAGQAFLEEPDRLNMYLTPNPAVLKIQTSLSIFPVFSTPFKYYKIVNNGMNLQMSFF